MIKQTQEDWIAEAEQRFGSDKKKWKFQCPACNHVASLEDFIPYSDDPASDSYQKCIGRVNGKGTKDQTDKGHGCNWAAYGLFGTVGKGRIVVTPGGKEVDVFEFATQEEAVTNE